MKTSEIKFLKRAAKHAYHNCCVCEKCINEGLAGKHGKISQAHAYATLYDLYHREIPDWIAKILEQRGKPLIAAAQTKALKDIACRL